MDPKPSTPDQRVARIASRAYGVVSAFDLLSAGVTREEIKTRLKRGSLIREFRGIYRVGHTAPSTEAHYLAAVKACGPAAVLSGRAAAYFWGILRGVRTPPGPEVIVPTARSIEGILTTRHRLHHSDKTTFRRIPITTPARTLVDIAPGTPDDELARACHEAGVRFKVTPGKVKAVLARRRRVPGSRKLMAIMVGDTKVTLSELERAFLELLREHGLPLPETNKVYDQNRIDCRWPEYRLTVELNSYRYHNSRASWEADYERERRARRRRDEFLRFTYDDVFEDPTYMLAELRRLLQRGSRTRMSIAS